MQSPLDHTTLSSQSFFSEQTVTDTTMPLTRGKRGAPEPDSSRAAKQVKILTSHQTTMASKKPYKKALAAKASKKREKRLKNDDDDDDEFTPPSQSHDSDEDLGLLDPPFGRLHEDLHEDLVSGLTCPVPPTIDEFEGWLEEREDGNLEIRDLDQHVFCTSKERVATIGSDPLQKGIKRRKANGWTLEIADNTTVVKSVLYFAYYEVVAMSAEYRENWVKNPEFDYWDTKGAMECGFAVDMLQFALRYKADGLKEAAIAYFEEQMEETRPDFRFLNGVLTMSKNFRQKKSIDVASHLTSVIMSYIIACYKQLVDPKPLDEAYEGGKSRATTAISPSTTDSSSPPTIGTSNEPETAPIVVEYLVKMHPVLAFQRTFGFLDGSLDTAVSDALNAAEMGCGLVIYSHCTACNMPMLGSRNDCGDCEGHPSLGLICVEEENEEQWRRAVQARVKRDKEENAKEQRRLIEKEKRKKKFEKLGFEVMDETDTEDELEPADTCPCGLSMEGILISCESETCKTRDTWWHLGCVGLFKQPDDQAQWFCPPCEEKMEKKAIGDDGIVVVSCKKPTILDDPDYQRARFVAAVAELVALIVARARFGNAGV